MSGAALAAGALVRSLLMPAQACDRIERFRPVAIALPDFLQGGPDDGTLAHALTGAVIKELAQNIRIALVESPAMSALPVVVDAPPNFSAWRRIGAEALVTGLVSLRAGRLRSGFRLWDTVQERQTAGQMYRAALADAPELAHRIAGAIAAQAAGWPATSLCKLL